MATIDTNMSLVMIDPNEPLELYDGTIIKGRLEWFLYALCCLDYGNLPTPLSRIEEWANALITNELPNMEPQSRAEEFFKAILTGDTSNLPTPQSRSEVLLDKLARGENDFTNVEKIQSRYEFLLAYLIKNGGGIGNIDYVLYKFQKEDETLYNTKQRPVKSAILKGCTLANIAKQDHIVNHVSQPISDYITLVHTGNENYKSIRLVNNGLLKPSTKYLIIFDIAENTLASKMQISNGATICGFEKVSYDTYPIDARQTGIVKSIVTSKNDLTGVEDYLYLTTLFGENGDGTQYVKLRIMMFEYQQGMENWDIPYFEGMQSVKMPVLTTTGKNLYPDGDLTINNPRTSVWYYTNGVGSKFGQHCKRGDGGNWFYLAKGTYTYKATTKNTLTNIVLIGEGEIVCTSGSTLESGWYVFRFKTGSESVDYAKVSNIQIELGSTATSYESHKSNILTTARKNLFNMNRPYDNLTDSQATVTQNLDEITVSSAESGIYVNANFILDKDFFAGKTVTGSCLYESDEKDIGTVQIVYQDGDGEHHYQWIRTPTTFTFPNNFIGDVTLSVYANNTGTPQSNTVTVKNIQLELGSTATPYEPYSEEVTLRGVGNVRDTLDCLTGKAIMKTDVFNDWDNATVVKMGNYGTVSRYDLRINVKPQGEIISNLFNKGVISTSDLECVNIHSSSNLIQTQVLTSKLSEDTIIGFKEWAKNNNYTIIYELETESIKTVDLTITDQGGATIPKLNTFDKITHVNVSATDILPGVEMEVATTIGEDLSGTLYSTIEDIETKQEVLKESNNAQTESINSTMLATTEIYESLL